MGSGLKFVYFFLNAIKPDLAIRTYTHNAKEKP